MAKIIFSEEVGELFDIFQGLWTSVNYELVEERKSKLGIEEMNKYEAEVLSIYRNNRIDTKKAKRYFSSEFEPEKFLLFKSLWKNKNLNDYLEELCESDEATVKKRILDVINQVTEDLGVKNVYEEEDKNRDWTDEEILDYISEMDISSNIKWETYLLLKDFNKYIGEYVEFIKAYKKEYKEAAVMRKLVVEELDNTFKEKIEREGLAYLNTVINNIVNLDKYENIYLTSSATKTLYIAEEIEEGNCYITVGTDLSQVWRNMEKKDDIEKNLDLLRDVFEGTRFNIIRLLLERDHYVQEIADKLELSKANVSYHMNFLLKSNVVSIEKDGQRNYYQLNKDAIRTSYDFIEGVLEL